jgi:hypothetical protein
LELRPLLGQWLVVNAMPDDTNNEERRSEEELLIVDPQLLTAAERLCLMWPLAKRAWGLEGVPDEGLRMRRDIVRVIRKED